MVRFIAALAAMVVAGSAQAQDTWTARPTLTRDRSPGSCSDTASPATMIVAGNKLTYKSVGGSHDFTIKADGTVDEVFKTTNGSALRVTGNAKTRDLEFVSQNTGCRYKLVQQ